MNVVKPKTALISLSNKSNLKKIVNFLIEKKVKDNRIKKTKNHLQNANEIGGINSTPPRATIKLLAIKIGWIKSNR